MCVILLMSTGLIFLASAAHPHIEYWLSWQSLWIKQCVYWCMGIVLIYIVSLIPLQFWNRCAPLGILMSLMLLIMVLLPGIGTSVKGSARWIRLPFMNIQVTELVKLSVVVFMASYLSKHHRMLAYHAATFYKPLLVVAVLAMCILAQPDLGSVVVIVTVTMVMMFLSGAPLKYFLHYQVLLLPLWQRWHLHNRTALSASKHFLAPWQHKTHEGYQIVNAFMAIGHGGLWGVGLGQSIQKQFYLPEAHTDFLFAVMTEEGGLIVALAFLMLFAFMILLILQTARRAQYRDDHFGYLLCVGIGFWLAIQGLINVAVNLGLLPTKGITLPLISYGGSSLLISCVALGMVFRTIKEHHEYR